MKRITIVATSYKSAKYFDLFFKHLTEINKTDEISVILIVNKPDKKEVEISQYYKKNFSDLFDIIYLEKLESIGESFNRAFKLSKTEYVTYIDVDDIRLPNSFHEQMNCLEHNKTFDFNYGDFILVENQGETNGQLIQCPEFDESLFVRGSMVGPTHFYRHSIFEKIGYWDEQFRSGGDFEFQVRAAAAGIKFNKAKGTMLYKTNEKFSTSAASNILQPIERTVIELRYGIYDKIDYRYYDKAMKYRIHEIKEGDKWIPVSSIIPDYEKFIEERQYLLPIGKRNHFINMLQRNLRLPLKMILKPRKFYYEYFVRNKIIKT